MNNEPSHVWRNLVTTYSKLRHAEFQFNEAKRAFLGEDIPRVELLRKALHDPYEVWAIHLVSLLPMPERMQLLPELVWRASYWDGQYDFVVEAILSLPREFVLENIEAFAEPYLQNPDLEDGYGSAFEWFLHLYDKLDKNMALRLAHRASLHSDEFVRQAGTKYLQAHQPASP